MSGVFFHFKLRKKRYLLFKSRRTDARHLMPRRINVRKTEKKSFRKSLGENELQR
jgi:hypothetical protein